MAPEVTMKISSWSRVWAWAESRPGATVIRQVHRSREPRLGAARPVNSTPGSSKRGASLGLAYQEFVRELRQAQAGLGFGDLGRSDGFVFRRLAREHGREAVANLCRLLEGIAGPEQAVDPRLRAMYL
jgi:hypothetical protein